MIYLVVVLPTEAYQVLNIVLTLVTSGPSMNDMTYLIDGFAAAPALMMLSLPNLIL